MRSKKQTTQGEGQPKSFTGGNGATLAVMLGIPTLRYLTDLDARDLTEFVRYFINQAHDEGFREGWDAASVYNSDERLLDVGPSQNH